MTAEEYINQKFGSDFDFTILRVWPFEKAPAELRQVSENPGTETWLLLIPPGYTQTIDWAASLQFGSHSVVDYPLENDWRIRIGEDG